MDVGNSSTISNAMLDSLIMEFSARVLREQLVDFLS